jgi:hypothetical protein
MFIESFAADKNSSGDRACPSWLDQTAQDGQPTVADESAWVAERLAYPAFSIG